MIERGRYKGWRSIRALDEDIVVSAVCITGKPECGVQMPSPESGQRHGHDDVDEWMEFHLRLTGHDLFTEIHREPVRWGPPTPHPETGITRT
ncbi:hypothetical protein ACH4E8_16180 [Streptomyces sp. NPDC017979]|uniref:DUF7848 domain-containing protein n=1 Tax=Streptomyces sp. NPDC017979 TaxID=3365024 RepID=UPI00378D6A14